MSSDLIIKPSQLVNQIIKNMNMRNEEQNQYQYENIHATDLTQYDSIKIDDNDEQLDMIIDMINIMKKELDD